MFRVVKRDGTITQFNVKKISLALQKAFDACNRSYDEGIIAMITLRVASDFEPKIQDGKINVEQIQDSAERVLSQASYTDVSKAYILYRKQHENIRNITATTLDYQKIVENYLNTKDWRIRENDAVPFSIGGLIMANNATITANYWLGTVYDEDISIAHQNGDIHIHNLNMLAGYRAGWSLSQLIRQGLRGGIEHITTGPAKHLSSICNQMVNFMGIMQNEWSSAQSFSHFDTYLSAFIKYEKLSYSDVKQCIQSFVYGINIPSRWGMQVPFSNISLDWKVPQAMKEMPAIIGNDTMDFSYGDCQAEMDLINRALLETMVEGDDSGKIFHYPLLTYTISQNFEFDKSENTKRLFEMVAKYGIAHFYNEINAAKRNENITGYYGYAEQSGSIGMVTINLPRIAYLAKDKSHFFKQLDKMMDIAVRSLQIKRIVLSKLLKADFYPYTKTYLSDFNHYFSTIGVIGMNEVGQNAVWLRADLSHEAVQVFAQEVLEYMNRRLREFSNIQGVPFNLEATPNDSSSQRLAKHDLEKYPDIKVNGEGSISSYTDSSQFVSSYNDLFAVMDVQDVLQNLYTSGTLFEVTINEKLEHWTMAELIVKKIVTNYHIPYFSLKMK